MSANLVLVPTSFLLKLFVKVAIPHILCNKFKATLSPKRTFFVLPLIIAIISPFFKVSPSSLLKETSTSPSRAKTLANTSAPAKIPSSFDIKFTLQRLFSVTSGVVVISSEGISSLSAFLIISSTINQFIFLFSNHIFK